MPNLDVTEILTDPDFFDILQLERRTKTVSGGGMSVLAPTSPPLSNFYGVVTNDRGEVLHREDIGEHIEGAILVVTKFRLTSASVSGGVTTEADLVHWDGRTYTVTTVEPYRRYGAGFVQARCTLLPLAGTDG